MSGVADGKKKRIGRGAKYSRKDVLLLRELFDRHDLDRDGRVTVGELVQALQEEKSMPHYELSAFRTIDKNTDGVLTFDEYLRCLYPYATEAEFQRMLVWGTPVKPAEEPEPLFVPNPEELEEIKQMFRMFDKNRNGVIDIAELATVVEKCGYEGADVEHLFKQTDKDMSGTISFEEFIQLVKSSFI
ncbi:hypothetical protein GPECTOR_8g184 [Gonium pectorale]|uniref:EF-hand domain-containing protein n=1 Tax=Gonium pectorale TaxID=33097 RepID=A0A150GSH1_GONPE|nr:hypothetical protein GPECTOR_8g184 [Gonium pectorale]|eukprot:KXZ52797.1 hypothetical protein GPECTOR_8g184 [Gonium pectorale]